MTRNKKVSQSAYEKWHNDFKENARNYWSNIEKMIPSNIVNFDTDIKPDYFAEQE